MKRLLIALAVIVLILGLAAGAAYWQFTSLFNPSPPEARATARATPLEAEREDLAQFAALIAFDRSFSDEARAAANARIDALRAQTDVLPAPRLRMELSSIVALADNAHTQLFSGTGGRANLMALRAHAFSDGVYVLRADAANADLLGARLIAIEGRPIEDVFTHLAAYRGGTPAWRRNWAQIVMSSPELMYGAGISSDPQRITWTLERGGERIDRTFTARAAGDDEPLPSTSRWLSPLPLEGEVQGTRGFTPAGEAPLALAEFNTPFRRAWIGDTCVLFLQLKSNQDADGQSINAFLDESTREMKTRQPCNVILDMRFNGGGDYTMTASFARELPTLIAPQGRIYILTSVDTFSAGITTTGLIKQAAPDRVTILGEEVGDRLAFWSEGSDGCLPHAKLCVAFSRVRHDYAAPCTDWRTCYWVNNFYPLRVASLAPDETISLSFADHAAGRDPVFARAVALARPP